LVFLHYFSLIIHLISEYLMSNKKMKTDAENIKCL
jgi:hypothetical protein